ncbi:hypothetical protein L596_002844 [Steinernema carpocapsae]|uniref:Uncharacterized protein n=1 Tax=Steinernema carpocapsae TaxID=34508 RepID=A0A4U8USA5_STECR|nr:hypothetical protein L596_002844 [Steinernema carpocapsae]
MASPLRSSSSSKTTKQKSPSYEMAIEGEGTQVQNVLLEKKTIRDMRQNPYALREGSQLRMLSSKKRKRIEERLTRVEENRKLAQLIDRRSRVYFPVVFVIFYYVKYANDDL